MYISIKEFFLRKIGQTSPKFLAKLLYYKAHHYWPSFTNPQNLDEKINWMKFNTDTNLWSVLADKYQVREYIKKKGLESTLPILYGVFDSTSQINYDVLPQSFVIKSTNGSSGLEVAIIKDKKNVKWNLLKEQLEGWLKSKPYFVYAEQHYLRIKPRIIIEENLLKGNNQSLVDYKFHCFNGHVESVLVCHDRVKDHAYKSIYDLNWECHPEWTNNKYQADNAIPKPASFEKMVEYSKLLSTGFPYIRIDWYDIDGKPVFGEMTFTPAGGYNTTMTKEYLTYLGSLLKIK